MAQGSDARDSGLIDRDGWIAYLQAHPGLTPDFARQAVGVPTVPSTVTAGDALAFPVTKLDLTSLGAPLNTSLDVRLDGTSIGTATVTGGTANVSVTVPAATTAGAHTLTLVADPERHDGDVAAHGRGGRAVLDDDAHRVTGEPGVRLVDPGAAHRDRRRRRVPVTGSVQFVSGSTVLATVPLTGGTATYRLPASTPAGTYPVVARFAGDATVTGFGVGRPCRCVVKQVTTTTSLSATPGFLFVPSILLVNVGQDNGRCPRARCRSRRGPR